MCPDTFKGSILTPGKRRGWRMSSFRLLSRQVFLVGFGVLRKESKYNSKINSKCSLKSNSKSNSNSNSMSNSNSNSMSNSRFQDSLIKLYSTTEITFPVNDPEYYSSDKTGWMHNVSLVMIPVILYTKTNKVVSQ